MKNLGQLMKQAQEMQSKLGQLQEVLAAVEITGSAGGGMVSVVMNGKGEARSVRIDPALLADGEAEILEDLVVAAINDAKGKSEVRVQEETSKLMGGLQLPPGFKLPF